jgi:OmcA/MtrC family decaheme c-type cytochrome
VSDLNWQLQSLTVPASGPPTVTFKVTDSTGAPVDLLGDVGRTAAKTVPYMSTGPSFTLAQLETDGTYTNWFEKTVASVSFTPPGGSPNNPNRSGIQPQSDPPSGTDLTTRITPSGMNDGVYTYTFSTPTTDASRLNHAGTLTVGVYGSRVTSRFGGVKRFPASATMNFAPGGGTAAAPYATVTDAACNTCHVALEAHNQRRTVQLCKTCHAGNTAAAGGPTTIPPGASGTPLTYADPDSGNTLDLRVMIHKIHNGANLPSVKSGQPFFIVGRNASVADFSDVTFPATNDVRNCVQCHQGGANSDDWKNKASYTACTSCHDNVRFDTQTKAGVPCALGTHETTPCDHPAGLASPTTNCTSCHAAGNATLGPDMVHQNPTPLAVAPFAYKILAVNVGGDRIAHVQFQVTNNGANSDIKSAPEWTQTANGASRLFVDIGWPTIEYTNDGAGYVDTTVKNAAFPNGVPGQGLPVQIDALATATPVAGQTNVFEVVSPTPFPASVTTATAVLEGHPAVNGQRVPVPNDVSNFGVGGAAGTRREVVTADKCNACHSELSAHGSNRNARPDVCVVCHTPEATDFIRRQQANPPSTDEQPIDFKVLVHEIHAADIRQTEVTIFGFGGSQNVFPAGFPGKTGDCTICHTGTSYTLPFKPEVLDTTVKVGDPAVQGDPAEVHVGKTKAVCTACHDAVHFEAGGAFPLCNTLVPANSAAACNHSGGPQADETQCATCHGTGGLADVAQVHAISQTPQ